MILKDDIRGEHPARRSHHQRGLDARWELLYGHATERTLVEVQRTGQHPREGHRQVVLGGTPNLSHLSYSRFNTPSHVNKFGYVRSRPVGAETP